MLQYHPFDAMPDFVDGIELSNPAMVERVRQAADKLSPYEISAHLANAITSAADAAHTRAWEEAHYGEASADAIVDAEYHDELAAAWSLIAAEHHLVEPDITLALNGLLH